MNFRFLIADFRLGSKRTNRRSSAGWLDSFSDNLKSKIENPKWLRLSVIPVVLAVAGTMANAQQAGKVFRIGYLDSSTASGGGVLIDAFRRELSKLGWIEGKDITIEYSLLSRKASVYPNSRLSWFASRLILSSPRRRPPL
jgi:hypothetical protein